MRCDVHDCQSNALPYRALNRHTGTETKIAYCAKHIIEVRRLFGKHANIRKAPSDTPANLRHTTDEEPTRTEA